MTTPKKILFYTQFNSRSRDTESVMEALVQEGHEVFLLTQTREGAYHEKCRELGVKTFAHDIKNASRISYFYKQVKYLVKFCKEYQIDVVFAHLENAGLAAVLAQFFIKAKVIVCRHIVDEAFLFRNKNFILQNKIVYRLAKNIIVVSKRAKDFMIAHEKIKAQKIHVINLAYNFGLYPKADPVIVREIKQQFDCELLIITACRLVKAKRPDYSIEAVSQLVREELNIKLIILGEGPEEENLKSLISDSQMENHIFLTGHKNNIIDYLSASDVLLHPSILDSSSVIIKEAGLLSKPVIACRDVGDVNEYLVDGENALLVQKDNPSEEMKQKIRKIYSDRSIVRIVEKLRRDVINRFSIKTIISEYDQFLS